MKKRRYRQIARLLYRYCCVMYMKRINGKWVVDDNIDGAVKALRDESKGAKNETDGGAD